MTNELNSFLADHQSALDKLRESMMREDSLLATNVRNYSGKRMTKLLINVHHAATHSGRRKTVPVLLRQAASEEKLRQPTGT